MKKFTTAICAILTTAAASSAFADAPSIIIAPSAPYSNGNPPALPHDMPIEVSTSGGSSICGPFDPNCSRRLARILSGIHVAPVQVSGGVRFGGNTPQAAVRFSTSLLAMDVPVGDIKALVFDAIYVPEAGGFRVRFSLADTDVLFFCKDETGNTVAPVATLFANCKPDGMVGIGGHVSQIQWDTATGRVAARWAEVNAVLNFLQNGNGLDYLKHRLSAYLGASADTIWYGTTPGTDGGSHSLLRANLGIMGMLRTDDNHWEIRGMAGYRPNVTAWNDFTIEARTQIMYHLLFSRTVMGDFGVDAQYQYNTVPSNSMGVDASDRDRNSLYLGAMFGLTWQ